MRVLVISPAENVEEETSTLIKLFEAGLNTFHVRKPEMDYSEYVSYLKKIPREYHHNLVLHSHYELKEDFEIKGIHVKEGAQRSFLDFSSLTQSASIHSLDNITPWHLERDYLFLSPIFDSISKKGYTSNFDQVELKNEMQKRSSFLSQIPLIALGGINPENVAQVKEMPFQGAALLGSLWNTSSHQAVENFKNVFEELCPQFAS